MVEHRLKVGCSYSLLCKSAIIHYHEHSTLDEAMVINTFLLTNNQPITMNIYQALRAIIKRTRQLGLYDEWRETMYYAHNKGTGEYFNAGFNYMMYLARESLDYSDHEYTRACYKFAYHMKNGNKGMTWTLWVNRPTLSSISEKQMEYLKACERADRVIKGFENGIYGKPVQCEERALYVEECVNLDGSELSEEEQVDIVEDFSVPTVWCEETNLWVDEDCSRGSFIDEDRLSVVDEAHLFEDAITPAITRPGLLTY